MLFFLVIIHFVSLITPLILALVTTESIQYIVYWILNIISPSINAQAIITYLIAKKSHFCAIISQSDFLINEIGNDYMAWNWIILVGHIIILLLLLIVIDSGLLHSSCCTSSSYLNFNENDLDDDVRAERYRVLSLDPAQNNQHLVNGNASAQEEQTDHLTVHDIVKYYRGRNIPAVNHLTFGAKRGEAFGLLGYNVSAMKLFFRSQF